jgi:hypothetical protein
MRVRVLFGVVGLAACNHGAIQAPAPAVPDAGLAGDALAETGSPPVTEPDASPPDSRAPDDAAAPPRPIPPIPPVCSSDGWCWSYPTPTGDAFGNVFGSGPDNVWIVGARAVAHWSGAAWQTSSFDSDVDAVWSDSGTDAWAVGQAIWHWDGSAWAKWSAGREDQLGLTSQYPLLSVWGAAANDVWAVGDYNILHWDGTTWAPAPDAMALGGYAQSVWGSASNDVWIAAFDTMLHWDGSAWASWTQDHDGGVLATSAIRAIHGTSANDVWAVGNAAFHWDGQTWSQASLPAPSDPDAGAPISAGLFAVGGGSSGDLWAGGSGSEEQPRGPLLRWDGSAWSDWGAAHAADLPPDLSVLGIWASSPADVWMVGSAAQAGWVWHWDGNSWSTLTGGRVENEPALRYAGVGGVWASSPSDVWAISSGTFSYAGPPDGRIVHFDGRSWSDFTPAIARGGATTPLDLEAIWGAAPDDAWIVGVDTVLRWDGTSWSDWLAAHPFPAHWEPDSWSMFVSKYGSGAKSLREDSQLRAIWGSGPNDVWAAGDLQYLADFSSGVVGSEFIETQGLMLHWDGTAWSSWTAAHPEATLRASDTIWGSSSSDVWQGGAFYGAEGELAHFDGVTWSSQDLVSPPDEPVPLAIWGSSASDVWAVVTSESAPLTDLLHWDGGAWSDWTAQEDASIPNQLGVAGLGGSSSTDVWLVSEDGTLMHWDGTRWSSVGAPVRDLSRVFVMAPDDVWAASYGNGVRVLHFGGL